MKNIYQILINGIFPLFILNNKNINFFFFLFKKKKKNLNYY
jgi:hypothetical protein